MILESRLAAIRRLGLPAGGERPAVTPRFLRIALIVGVAAAVYLIGAASLFAEWPRFEPDPAPGEHFRGPGSYLSWMKILGAWFIFLLWVRSADWINIDMEELKLPQLSYKRWNPITVGTFMTAFVLLWLIPYFWIGFCLVLIAYLTPFTTYVVYRNSLVDNNVRVFTREHLRFWFATKLNYLGMNFEVEKLDPREGGPPAKLVAHGAPDNPTNNARYLLARQSPGLLIAREIVADALGNRGSAIMLDYTQQGAAINVMIDGAWLTRGNKERELADPALEALKLLCGLNPKDRQNLQQGIFAAEYQTEKPGKSAKPPKPTRYVGSFTSQGTPSGERVMIEFEDKTIRFKTLDDLGMRVKMQGQLKELLESKKGMLLFSALPRTGLRNSMDVVLRTCDRFVREFIAVEDEAIPYQPVENVPVTTYKSSQGETPVTVLPKLLRTQPEVVVVRDLVGAETLNLLCETAAEKLVVGTVRAKDCPDALLRVLTMGVQPAQFAETISAVVGQRLVRKLCPDCMEPYAPPAQVLQQLGLPPGRIEAFYRPRQPKPDEPNKPCETCNGIGYLGRTAIFELLLVGDNVRAALSSKPTLDNLRRAARKDGMKSLQEEGILLVAKGVTSLPELLRVLKQ